MSSCCCARYQLHTSSIHIRLTICFLLFFAGNAQAWFGYENASNRSVDPDDVQTPDTYSFKDGTFLYLQL